MLGINNPAGTYDHMTHTDDLILLTSYNNSSCNIGTVYTGTTNASIYL